MFIVVSTSFLAIFLAYLSKYKKYPHALEWAFVLVTLIASIRFNYGSDYPVYYEYWKDYRFVTLREVFSGLLEWDPGWSVLYVLFSFENGFFVLVALLNIFQNYVCYKLIKFYAPADWRWMAMMIYLCSGSYYLLNFTIMRQAFAESLFMFAFLIAYPQVSARNSIFTGKANIFRLIIGVFIVLLASTMHKSALICVPLIFIGYFSFNNLKPLVVVSVVATLLLFTSRDITSDVLSSMMSLSEFSRYERSYGIQGTSDSLGIGFLLLSLPFLIMIYFMLYRNRELSMNEKYLTVVTYVGIMFIPFTLVDTLLIGRLGIYFTQFQIVVTPLLYSKIKDKEVLRFLTFILVFITLYGYLSFFHDGGWREASYTDYRTIFEVL